jgi:hypothetical protein
MAELADIKDWDGLPTPRRYRAIAAIWLGMHLRPPLPDGTGPHRNPLPSARRAARIAQGRVGAPYRAAGRDRLRCRFPGAARVSPLSISTSLASLRYPTIAYRGPAAAPAFSDGPRELAQAFGGIGEDLLPPAAADQGKPLAFPKRHIWQTTPSRYTRPMANEVTGSSPASPCVLPAHP